MSSANDTMLKTLGVLPAKFRKSGNSSTSIMRVTVKYGAQMRVKKGQQLYLGRTLD